MNLFKKKKVTITEKLDKEENHIRGYLDEFLKYRPRIERLAKLYPDVISQTDLFISKRIVLKDDVELPEEFLCSCKLLGLKIKDISRNRTYSDKTQFYIVVHFNGILGEECE